MRYERRAGAETAVKVMTDGILLRELQARPRASVPSSSDLGISSKRGLRHMHALELHFDGGTSRLPR